MNIPLDQFSQRIERNLAAALSDTNVPERLAAAMRHSTLAAGKRVRARMVYAAGVSVGASLEKLDAVATAIECIHSYSLIHDDLPAMDDDDLRRGKATNHIAFDEATAILAGDALLTLAFATISNPKSQLSDGQARQISHRLAQNAGAAGMVGGQIEDILATQQTLSETQLANIHQRKTGDLILASVLCGALCADKPEPSTLAALETYAIKLGHAFQVVDDILDVESSTEMLGKTSGADNAIGKSTYPALIGLEQSKALAQTLYQEAIASIDGMGDNNHHLLEIADFLVNRSH